MRIEREAILHTFGAIAGIGAAAFIVYAMFGEGGGLGLPKGRYPIILLIALVVAPPLIGGAVAYGIGMVVVGLPIALLLERASKGGDEKRAAAEKETEARRKAEQERTREQRKAAEESARQKREAEQAAAREKSKREETDQLEKVRKAIANGDVKTVESALTQRPPDFVSMLLAPDPATGTTPGHTAARNGHAGIMEAISYNGPLELYRDRDGKTMLDVGAPAKRDELERAYCRGYARRVVEGWKLEFDDVKTDVLARFFVERAKLRHDDKQAIYTIDGTRADMAAFFSAAAAKAEQEGQYERALTIAIGGARILPDAFEPYVRAASANLHLKAYGAVIEDTNAAIKLDAQKAEPYRLRGLALAALGRAAEAVSDFTQSLALDPQQPALQQHLDAAQAQRAQGDEDHLKSLRAAVARGDVAAFEQGTGGRESAFLERIMEPEADRGTSPPHQAARGGHMGMIELLGAYSFVRFHRDRDGKTLLDLGTPEQTEALEAAYARGFGRRMTESWKLTEMIGENVEVFAKFWQSRLKLRHDEKEPVFKITGFDRDASAFFCNASSDAQAATNYAKALTLAKAAVELDPNSSHAQVMRGWAHLNSGQYEEVLTADAEAIRLEPANYWAYRHRGIALAALGRNEEAVADHAKSLEINPDQPELQERLNNLMMS